MSATDRLPRLLALLPYLIAHPARPMAETAAVFGITERQLVADIELLFVCGLPGHGPGDLIDISYEPESVTVQFDAGLERPLRLTADEALALIVALRTLADVPGLRESDALHRALAKLETAAGEAAAAVGSRVAVEVESAPGALATVQQALDTGRRLHLTYHVPGRDETTERDVDPMRVLIVEGRTYLEGWCRRVEAVRLFRLDRMVAVALLDVAAEVPAEATPRDVGEGLFQPSPDDVAVTLELGPGAGWVADYYPCESVTEIDGGLRVVLRTSDTRWVRRLALRLGATGRVVAPEPLAEAVRADAAAALSAYAAD